jgi:sortase (surface protein transpeptidase)
MRRSLLFPARVTTLLLMSGVVALCAACAAAPQPRPAATALSTPTAHAPAQQLRAASPMSTARPTEHATPVVTATTAPTPPPTPPPTPAPTLAPTPTPFRVPVELRIPRIGLDAPVLAVGVTDDGTLGVPPDDASVGWYEFGAVPGQVGSAVLDGHVDSRTGPAIFYRLDELAPGDEIEVRLADGSAARFMVRETGLYWLADAPLERVFGPSDRSQLVLITCGGPFDRAAGGYQQRRIVFAELTMP